MDIEKLLRYIFRKTSKNVLITPGDIIYKGIFEWELIIENYRWRLCDCNLSNETKDECCCETYRKFLRRNKIPNNVMDMKFDNLYCHFKQVMGDEYPSVLRIMKNKIKITNEYSTQCNKEWIRHQETKRHLYENINEYNYDLLQGRINPNYILIIQTFLSSDTSKEQLIAIFNQSYISVVFIDDL
jgi:hypothetical protein